MHRHEHDWKDAIEFTHCQKVQYDMNAGLMNSENSSP